MNGKQLLETLDLKTVCGSVESFDGVYAGDLLSRAMSHVEADNLWITIMNNMNVIAVASLTEAAAVLLAEFFCPQLEYAGAVAGVTCVLGHIFPFYLRFKGGKGFAPYLGMTLALNWKLALFVLVLVVLVTLITDYLVLEP